MFDALRVVGRWVVALGVFGVWRFGVRKWEEYGKRVGDYRCRARLWC